MSPEKPYDELHTLISAVDTQNLVLHSELSGPHDLKTRLHDPGQKAADRSRSACPLDADCGPLQHQQLCPIAVGGPAMPDTT
ncbi:hypothetical protein KU43P_14800 [Pseudomonas sp. KU43P]|nr:hypothetical protein KU43P_14800 [Pseudomonas sp. KU43P]